MTRLKLVIFDVDGTLVDSQAHIKGAMAAAFAEQGLPAPHDMLGIVGLSLPEAMARLAPQLDDPTRATMVATYKQAFHDLRAADLPSPLYPGARAALDALRARDEVLLGLATGKSRKGLDHVIEAHDLGRYFVTQQVADHHPSKPHPSMVLTALAETGVEPGDAVVIGDTSFDMDMARAAGVTGIGVSWGYHPRPALAAAARVLDRFDDLLPTLDELWRNT
ncbi:HAD-IA family hydrolase [Actibacterium sp. XHP0104]|uniref:HAD-IA family hydrolase n=1 Tax=Actibacterium sp. XHP0104 TaxID=2984335 RepID=UPI0021E7D0FD|nr:HAD-IA family hydrolase [Actibacterium sp. XHP0104]MCV2882391.1 HAD-IA family hydrolase [Actibacterium sp. XHP0104]